MAESEIMPMEPVRALVSPEEAGQMMAIYQDLCMKILVPWEKRRFEKGPGGVEILAQDSDFQRISVYDKASKRSYARDFPKKSAFRKLALFYGVSTDLVSKEKTLKEGGGFVWTYRVRASITSKDGRVRSVTQEGSCDSKEMERGGQNTRIEHDSASTALTRATNRAISDLIGFGQVSAEEMTPGSTPEPREIVPSEAKVVEEKPVTPPAEEHGADIDQEKLKRVSEALHQYGPISTDDLAEGTGLPEKEVGKLLDRLRMEGHAFQQVGGYWKWQP